MKYTSFHQTSHWVPELAAAMFWRCQEITDPAHFENPEEISALMILFRNKHYLQPKWKPSPNRLMHHKHDLKEKNKICLVRNTYNQQNIRFTGVSTICRKFVCRELKLYSIEQHDRSYKHIKHDDISIFMHNPTIWYQWGTPEENAFIVDDNLPSQRSIRRMSVLHEMPLNCGHTESLFWKMVWKLSPQINKLCTTVGFDSWCAHGSTLVSHVWAILCWGGISLMNTWWGRVYDGYWSVEAPEQLSSLRRCTNRKSISVRDFEDRGTTRTIVVWVR